MSSQTSQVWWAFRCLPKSGIPNSPLISYPESAKFGQSNRLLCFSKFTHGYTSSLQVHYSKTAFRCFANMRLLCVAWAAWNLDSGCCCEWSSGDAPTGLRASINHHPMKTSKVKESQDISSSACSLKPQRAGRLFFEAGAAIKGKWSQDVMTLWLERMVDSTSAWGGGSRMPLKLWNGMIWFSTISHSLFTIATSRMLLNTHHKLNASFYARFETF